MADSKNETKRACQGPRAILDFWERAEHSWWRTKPNPLEALFGCAKEDIQSLYKEIEAWKETARYRK